MSQATVALILADKFDTVKASCVYKVSPTTTAAVEAVHKVAKADTSFTVGCGALGVPGDGGPFPGS